MQEPRPPLPLHVEQGPGRLVIRWPWRKEESGTWLVAALSVLTVMSGLIAFELPPLLPFDGEAMRPAGIMLLSVFGYCAFACLLNETEISVRAGMIEVVHRPLPWWPRRLVPVSEITQLFCRENLEHSEYGNLISESYSVHIELRSGRKQRLCGKLWQAEQARWLEEAIEEALGIEDKPVAGEAFKMRLPSKYAQGPDKAE